MTKQIPGQESMMFDDIEPVVPSDIEPVVPGAIESDYDRKVERLMNVTGLSYREAARRLGERVCQSSRDTDGNLDNECSNHQSEELDYGVLSPEEKVESWQKLMRELFKIEQDPEPDQTRISSIIKVLWKIDHNGEKMLPKNSSSFFAHVFRDLYNNRDIYKNNDLPN